MSLPTSSNSPYMFSRSYTDSARLIIQHWLWQHRVRYLLHPSIPLPTSSSSSSQPFRIADIGSGNAIYLLELSASLSPNTNIYLDGFDISTANFPAKEWLPDNMSLQTLDIFTQDLPQELVGKYDVVHIRAFAIIVHRNDPGVILRNAVRMLKPSGHLQWDEIDLSTLHASPPSLTSSTALLAKFKSQCRSSGIFWDWIHTLPSHFQSQGLEAVQETLFEPIKEQNKAATDNYLMALEDTCAGFEAKEADSWGSGWRDEGKSGDRSQHRQASSNETEARSTRKEEGWWTLFAGTVQEMKSSGGSLTADMVVVVGRKPSSSSSSSSSLSADNPIEAGIANI